MDQVTATNKATIAAGPTALSPLRKGPVLHTAFRAPLSRQNIGKNRIKNVPAPLNKTTQIKTDVLTVKSSLAVPDRRQT
jgi:hypothetical protein